MSFKTRFETCSNGQFTIPVHDVFGPITLSATPTSSCRDSGSWSDEAYDTLVGSGAAITGFDSYVYIMPQEARDGSCSIGVGHLCKGGCNGGVNFPKIWLHYDFGLSPDTLAHEVCINVHNLLYRLLRSRYACNFLAMIAYTFISRSLSLVSSSVTIEDFTTPVSREETNTRTHPAQWGREIACSNAS